MKLRTISGSCEWHSNALGSDKLTVCIARYHGGWLAPNIYFLGHAGCVQVNGIRIAGASGIFNAKAFQRGERRSVRIRDRPPL